MQIYEYVGSCLQQKIFLLSRSCIGKEDTPESSDTTRREKESRGGKESYKDGEEEEVE